MPLLGPISFIFVQFLGNFGKIRGYNSAIHKDKDNRLEHSPVTDFQELYGTTSQSHGIA